MKKLLLLIALVLSVVSCGENLFGDIHLKIDASLPAGESVITDRDLLSFTEIEDLVDVNSDDLLQLTISNSPVEYEIPKEYIYFNFPEYGFDFEFNIPVENGGTMVPLPQGLTKRYIAEFGEGKEVDTLIVESTEILLKIENPNMYDFSKFKCTIPQITKDGKEVVIVPNQPLIIDDTYIFDFSDQGDTTWFDFNFSGEMPLVNQIKGSVSINDVETKYVSGYLGRYELTKNEVEIDITGKSYQNFISNSEYIRFRNPYIYVDITNSISIPVLVNINDFSIDGKTVELKNGLGGNQFIIDGNGSYTVLVSNTSTLSGNGLSDAITTDFTKAKIDYSIIANPNADEIDNSSIDRYNSVYVTDKIEITGGAIFDFDFIIDGARYTKEINMLKVDENENIDHKELIIKMTGYNEFAVDFHIHPYITTDNTINGEKTYLADSPILFAASQSNEKPSSTSFSPFYITEEEAIILSLDESKVDALLNSQKIFFDILYSTRGAENRDEDNYVKIFSPTEFLLDIVVGLESDINLTPTEN